VLAQVKNNLGPPQPSLVYELVRTDGGAPAVTWHGPGPWAADALLAASSHAPPRAWPVSGPGGRRPPSRRCAGAIPLPGAPAVGPRREAFKQ
jgi:hypothetical protein